MNNAHFRCNTSNNNNRKKKSLHILTSARSTQEITAGLMCDGRNWFSAGRAQSTMIFSSALSCLIPGPASPIVFSTSALIELATGATLRPRRFVVATTTKPSAGENPSWLNNHQSKHHQGERDCQPNNQGDAIRQPACNELGLAAPTQQEYGISTCMR